MMPKKQKSNKKRGKRANAASSVSRKRTAAKAVAVEPKRLKRQEAAAAADNAVQHNTAERQESKAAEPATATVDSTAARSKSKDKELASQSKSQQEQAVRQSAEDQSMRTRELRSGAYRALQDACEKSKHLSGQLRQQRSAVLLTLPSSLPGSLIVRAINKSGFHYQQLQPERIAAAGDQQPQLELLVDGLNDEQLKTLIAELDELIGDFTGRN